MNYKKIYSNLISKAKERRKPDCYCENHHIIPKSHGGSDRKENLVYLTAREHFLAHWLLLKIHMDKSMTFAFFSMTKPVGNGRVRYTSRSFKYAREQMSKWLSQNRSGERHPMHGLKGVANPNYGSKRTSEAKIKMSEKARLRIGEKNPRAKKIICKETGEVFGSISLAKKTHKKGNINYSLRTGGTAGGLHFCYLSPTGEAIEIKPTLSGYPSGENVHNSIKIRSLTTGEVFLTASLAAKSIGVTSQAIMTSIKDKRKCKGVAFEKV